MTSEENQKFLLRLVAKLKTSCDLQSKEETYGLELHSLIDM